MTRKIKIVFGVNDFTTGGMQRQFSEQIKFFDREKFDISLITLFEFPEKENLYEALPADLEVHRLSFRGWWDIRAWVRLYRLLRTIDPQIVVSSLFFGNAVFRLLRPFVGYVSIAREHNTYLYKPKLQILIDRLLAPLSYRIVAVSTTVADFTAEQERLAREKFEVIHNGRDIEDIRKELSALPEKDTIRTNFGFTEHDVVLVNVARLTPQKNHKLLIDGFMEFYKKNPSYKLAIVGGGDLQEELEAYVHTRSLENAIRFFGHQSDTTQFYKMADLFVSASDMEGFSNACIKALVAGLPIVSTMTAGTDEFLVDGYNGYVIEESTKEGVVRALGSISLSKLAELSEHARETAERFSIVQTVRKYEELFQQARKST